MQTPQEYNNSSAKRNNNFERWERFIYEGDDPVVYKTMTDILNGKAVIEKMRGFNVYKTRVCDLRILFVDLGSKCFAFLLKLEGHRYERLPFKKNQGYLNLALEKLSLKNALQNDESYETPNDTQAVEEKFYYFNRSIILPNQQQKDTLNLSTPLVVTGGAGTGKTMMALIWIKQWLSAQHDQPILYVTPNSELANRMVQELLDHNISAAQVHCLSYQSLILQHDTSITDLESVNDTTFVDWYHNYLKKQRRHVTLTRNDAEAVYEVFREIATSSIRNPRRRDSLLSAKNDELYNMFDAYQTYLSNENKYDAALYNAQFVPQYFGCIADEAQQLTPIQWQVLCKLVTPTYDGLKIIFVGDYQNQRLFDQQCLLTEKITRLNAICRSTHVDLDCSYRVPHSIQVFNNNLIHLKQLKHGEKKLNGSSDENLVEGQVHFLEFHENTQELCTNLVKSPKCFVITTEKSRQRAVRRFGERALIFTVDEVGGQECEKAILFELFGQDEDDLLLKFIPQHIDIRKLRFDNQQPLLIHHENQGYYIYGFSSQKWQLKKIELQTFPGHEQLNFPTSDAADIYITYCEALKPMYAYLARANLHIVQEDPHLEQIERHLSIINQSRKMKSSDNDYSTLNTWINSRIIASTRSFESLLVVLPLKNQYPLLYNLLRNNHVVDQQNIIEPPTLDTLELQQEWLNTADDFIRSRSLVLEQRAKNIYEDLGLNHDEIKARVQSLSGGAIVIDNKDYYLSPFERKTILNCLRSNNLFDFFQTHPFDFLKKIISSRDNYSVLEMILKNQEYSQCFYYYLLKDPCKVQELEGFYELDELLSLIMQTQNYLLLKLLIAFGRDELTSDDTFYAQIKKTCDLFMLYYITSEQNAKLPDPSKLLIKRNLLDKSTRHETKSTVVLLLMGASQEAINSISAYLEYNNGDVSLNKKNKLFNAMIESMSIASGLGDVFFIDGYLSALFNDPALTTQHKMNLCEIAILYEQYEILNKFLFYIQPVERSKIFMRALQENETTIIELCLKYQMTFTHIDQNYAALILRYSAENPVLEIEYNKHQLIKKSLQELSYTNLREYFNFLINYDVLNKILDKIQINEHYSDTMLDLLLQNQVVFQNFLDVDLEENFFEDTIIYKLCNDLVVSGSNSSTKTGMGYFLERGITWLLEKYLAGHLKANKSIASLLCVRTNITEQKSLLTDLLYKQEYYDLLHEHLKNNISAFIQLESSWPIETLLGIARITQNVKLLQLIIAYGRDVPENLHTTNSCLISDEQRIDYQKVKDVHSRSMRMYLFDGSFENKYDFIDNIYHSYDIIGNAVFDNPLVKRKHPTLDGEVDLNLLKQKKYREKVLQIALLLGNEKTIRLLIRDYTFDIINYEHCFLLAYLEHYSILQMLIPQLDIFIKSELAFYSIVKKKQNMLEMLIISGFDFEILDLDKRNILQLEPEITSLGIAFKRLQRAIETRKQDLINNEHVAVENAILNASSDTLNRELNQKEPERLAIHASIECCAPALLSAILTKDSSSVNIRYKGEVPFIMIMRLYKAFNLNSIASMLNMLNKYSAKLNDNDRGIAEQILSILPQWFSSQPENDKKNQVCFKLIKLAIEKSHAAAQETTHPAITL